MCQYRACTSSDQCDPGDKCIKDFCWQASCVERAESNQIEVTTSTVNKNKVVVSARGKGAGRKGGYTVAESLDGAGTISGVISASKAGPDPIIKVTKDNAVCEHHKEEIKRPKGSILVKGGKVKNAVVWLDGVKEGKAFSAGSVTVDNVGCDFTPRIQVARKGDTLVAKNSDDTMHNTNVRLVNPSVSIMNVALPQKGSTQTERIKFTGNISVTCDAHPWMQAYVFVTTHPYATVTDENGAFEFAQVPNNGKGYTLKVWHEELGEKVLKGVTFNQTDVALDLSAE
tara:strand:- start:1112 stop:1966 length:855 start_codon:yes stop_codon:yes gene_type:complete